MRTRRALAPLLLVAATGLAACGGDDDSGSAGQGRTPGSSTVESTDAGSGAVTACDLLSTDEVEAAVGTPVKAGVASTGPAATGGTYSGCVWQSDDPDHPADQATLTIYPNPDAADSARASDSVDVEGLGDKAFSGAFSSVWVYVGEQSFFTQWYTFSATGDEDLPQSTALARAVVDAL